MRRTVIRRQDRVNSAVPWFINGAEQAITTRRRRDGEHRRPARKRARRLCLPYRRRPGDGPAVSDRFVVNELDWSKVEGKSCDRVCELLAKGAAGAAAPRMSSNIARWNAAAPAISSPPRGLAAGAASLPRRPSPPSSWPTAPPFAGLDCFDRLGCRLRENIEVAHRRPQIRSSAQQQRQRGQRRDRQHRDACPSPVDTAGENRRDREPDRHARQQFDRQAELVETENAGGG